MSARPSIFIGSSTEGLTAAKALQAEIAVSHFADAILWTQDVFKPSSYIIETLLKQLELSDFGVFVLTPDDAVESKGAQSRVPRDNVIFELGLFMGHLGRHRCFFVYDDTITWPSDLIGMVGQPFQQTDNMRAAMGPICRSIEQQVQDLGLRPRLLKFPQHDIPTNTDVPNIAGRWASYLPDGVTDEEQGSVLTISQAGAYIRADLIYEREGRERVFALEGRFTAGHLVLFFEDVRGRGYIVGTLFLHLTPDLHTLTGKSLYHDPNTNDVLSKERNFTRAFGYR